MSGMSTDRYYPFSRYLRETFGERVFKVVVDGDFTCPNRDGLTGTGGCAYCNPDAFAALGVDPSLSIREQVEDGIRKKAEKYGARKFLVYFQNYSNTYGSTDKLERLYNEAIDHPDIIGLMVGTRPDCLPDDILNLLAAFHRRTHLWVEVGLQSGSDAVLEKINRGHSVADWTDAVARLRRFGIRVCAHIILGLPGDLPPAETARILNEADVQGVKIHQLQIVEGTPFARHYREGGIDVPDLEAFLAMTGVFLEHLDPKISIHRLYGIGNNNLVIAPDWGYRRVELARIVDRYFEEHGIRQGRKFSILSS